MIELKGADIVLLADSKYFLSAVIVNGDEIPFIIVVIVIYSLVIPCIG